MFDTLFYQPILQALLWFYSITGNLGFAIILLTSAIKAVLIPLTLPSLKSADKMRALKPEMDKIKLQFKDDKLKQQKAQMELFQKHEINPAAGCLPQIIQLVVLITLYRVFMDFLGNGEAGFQQTTFLWLDLTQADTSLILPFITALSQLVLSLLILPAASTSAEKALAASTPNKKDDKAAGDMSDMAATMQQQMVFIMPVMTFFLATRFPSGLALYWLISTLFSLAQQIYVSGPSSVKLAFSRLPLIGSRFK